MTKEFRLYILYEYNNKKMWVYIKSYALRKSAINAYKDIKYVYEKEIQNLKLTMCKIKDHKGITYYA